ncbi:DUF4251 domain-containing protein [Bacteroides pyogenes]
MVRSGIQYPLRGGGKGLIFNAPIENYRMAIDQKGNAVIKFFTRNSEDR